MTLRFVAQIIEEIYYSGRVKTDKRLDKKDFLQYGRTAYANLLKMQYFKLRNEDTGLELYYLGNLMQPRTLQLGEAGRRGVRRVNLAKNPLIILPKNVHVFALRPLDEDCDCGSPSMVQTGEQEFYCGEEFSDFPFYVVKGGEIEAYHFPECVKEVEVDGLWDSETAEIGADVAFDVINAVLGVTLKVAGFPIDKTDDNNPNVTTVKQRLAETDGV